jgi:hypothetical protein
MVRTSDSGHWAFYYKSSKTAPLCGIASSELATGSGSHGETETLADFAAFSSRTKRLRKSGGQRANLRNIPPGLKPYRLCGPYGTTEVVPFQSKELFRSL